MQAAGQVRNSLDQHTYSFSFLSGIFGLLAERRLLVNLQATRASFDFSGDPFFSSAV
jgi:hypothetical protein